MTTLIFMKTSLNLIKSLKSYLEKRFPLMEVVDAFGIFDQQHATEHDLYKMGAKITLTVFFH